MLITPRPYQDELIDGAVGSFRDGYKGTCIVLPTGGGKTIIICGVVERAVKNGARCVILVHRQELMDQASAKLRAFGIPHGFIARGMPMTNEPVQVASVQTMVKRLDSIKPFNLVIVDETHHVVANTYRKILNAMPKAVTLGVTATPLRRDGKGLGITAGGVFDKMLVGPSMPWMIDNGFLVKPLCFVPQHGLDFSQVKTVAGDYDLGEMASMLDRPDITGDVIEHWMRVCPNVPTIAFCSSVDHSYHVEQQFNDAGIRAYTVHGAMGDAERKAALRGLADGTIKVICNMDLISEGFDVPKVSAIIMLRKTKSLAIYLQQAGRALRPADDKPHAFLLDHVGNVIEHEGGPEVDRNHLWTLEGRKKKKKGGAGPMLKFCQGCFLAIGMQARICPYCGFAIQVAERDITVDEEGQLICINDESELAKQFAAKRDREKHGSRTLEDLERIEKERGYRKGWAKHVFAARQKKEEERRREREAFLSDESRAPLDMQTRLFG